MRFWFWFPWTPSLSLSLSLSLRLGSLVVWWSQKSGVRNPWDGSRDVPRYGWSALPYTHMNSGTTLRHRGRHPSEVAAATSTIHTLPSEEQKEEKKKKKKTHGFVRIRRNSRIKTCLCSDPTGWRRATTLTKALFFLFHIFPSIDSSERRRHQQREGQRRFGVDLRGRRSSVREEPRSRHFPKKQKPKPLSDAFMFPTRDPRDLGDSKEEKGVQRGKKV
jgi:hypothetical protein